MRSATLSATFKPSFVNFLGWSSLSLSAYCGIMGLVVGLMMNSFLEGDGLWQEIRDDPELVEFLDSMPFGLGLMELTLVSSAVWLVTCVVSVGLLKRREWARKGFIVLMVLGVVWSLIPIFTLDAHPPTPDANGDPVVAAFGAFFAVLPWLSVLLAVALVALHGWIIYKLMSAPVKEEFSAA